MSRHCPTCQAELGEGATECSACGWKPPAEHVEVTRLTSDMAVTPDGQPNLTRQQFEAQRQREAAEFFEAGRAGARKAAEARRFEEGGGDIPGAMALLVEAFHGLQRPYRSGELQGVRPWDAVAFWQSADKCLFDEGSRQAAAFVLHVWNSDGLWSLSAEGRKEAQAEAKRWNEEDPFPPGSAGPLAFDHSVALSRWDRGHRGAYIGWAEAPWWA